MSDNEVIYDFNDQLKYLESLDYIPLTAWIYNLFHNDETEPLFISLSDADKCNIICGFYKGSVNINFKTNIRKAILQMFYNYYRNEYSDEILFNLLGIIGFLNFTSAMGKIESLLKSRYLECHSYRDVNIQSFMERVFAGLIKNKDDKREAIS